MMVICGEDIARFEKTRLVFVVSCTRASYSLAIVITSPRIVHLSSLWFELRLYFLPLQRPFLFAWAGVLLSKLTIIVKQLLQCVGVAVYSDAFFTWVVLDLSAYNNNKHVPTPFPCKWS